MISHSFWQNCPALALLSLFYFAGFCCVRAAGGGGPLNFNVPQNLVVCEDANLTWTGGEAPYTLAFNINGQDLETAVIINDVSYDWTVDVGPGFPIQIQLADSNNRVANSSTLFTKAGNQTCDLITPDTTPPASTTTTPVAAGPKASNTGSRGQSATSTGTTTTPSTSSTSAGGGGGAKSANNAANKSSGPSTTTIVVAVVITIGVINAIVIGIFFWRRTRARKNRLSVDLLGGGNNPPPPPQQPYQQYAPPPVPPNAYPGPQMTTIESRDNGAGGTLLVASYQQPQPHQPQPAPQPTYTYSEKVSMMRQNVKHPYDPTPTTNRIESSFDMPVPSGSTPLMTYPPAPSSSSHSGSGSGSSSGYYQRNGHGRLALVVANSDTPSSHSQLSSSKQYDTYSGLSTRNPEADMSSSDVSHATGANSSTAHLIPQQQGPVREHDGGVRLAGGPQELPWQNGGTLPPAYGDF